MHVKRVELENIKSYAGAVFEFECGTTAITGDNGAGKTTILESIAWALFDLLAYKKEEFVRRGAKKGSVRVTFESGLDEREYTVYRDTGTGYNVYDPALKLRIADKKEEVRRFLWEHLGVEPGTDLETLFKHAIGVPQGTFTAIFLATPAERKKTFDTLLKVEEYRRSAEELHRTARHIEGQIGAVNVRLARAEGETARIDAVGEERSSIAGQAAGIRSEIGGLETEAAEKRAFVTKCDEAETRLTALIAQAEALKAERERAELVKSQRERELELSRAAAAVIEAVKPEADRHQQSLGRIHELERERGQRQLFRDELSQIENAEARVAASRSNLQQEIDRIQEMHAAIENLRPNVAEQERLEANAANMRNAVAAANAALRQIEGLNRQLEHLRESYRANQAQLTAARERSATAGDLERHVSRDIEIVRDLAKLNAALERDEAFQREIRNGLCPILSERCLNLKEGETLESFVTSQFDEIRVRIETLQTEHVEVTTAVVACREAAGFLVQLPVLESRDREIGEEGKRLRQELESLAAANGSADELRAELERIEQQLNGLDNPKTRIALLETEVRRERDLREQLSAIEKNLERLESDRRIAVEKLEAYKDLDQHWAEAAGARDATAEAYRKFIANEELALRFGEREASAAAADSELSSVITRLKAAEADCLAAGQGYDRARHLAERGALIELEKGLVGLNTKLHGLDEREKVLATELERLEETKRAMQDEFREKQRLERTLEATNFIRETLKRAAPLVARNYVWHVSQEANMMYREITGNAERTLKWASDYGISLEEGGYDRPFVSLSGGEQMAAALAVRLSLLKQLSDIRIAFFDEPTANMDAERRENLAQQIGQIKHFDQLFVISHDDTFEGYMDHEVRVEK